jgi:sRNA-binding carbon storage regulator CsrA
MGLVLKRRKGESLTLVVDNGTVIRVDRDATDEDRVFIEAPRRIGVWKTEKFLEAGGQHQAEPELTILLKCNSCGNRHKLSVTPGMTYPICVCGCRAWLFQGLEE